jgi:hypothetical protein
VITATSIDSLKHAFLLAAAVPGSLLGFGLVVTALHTLRKRRRSDLLARGAAAQPSIADYRRRARRVDVEVAVAHPRLAADARIQRIEREANDIADEVRQRIHTRRQLAETARAPLTLE